MLSASVELQHSLCAGGPEGEQTFQPYQRQRGALPGQAASHIFRLGHFTSSLTQSPSEPATSDRFEPRAISHAAQKASVGSARDKVAERIGT